MTMAGLQIIIFFHVLQEFYVSLFELHVQTSVTSLIYLLEEKMTLLLK
jgi:hypothetical protein